MSGELEKPMAGGCACGAVRYRLTASPLFVHCCHCTRCQRESGAAFAVNALIETAQVALDGRAPGPVSVPSASGADQIFLRCPDCQLALWSHYAGAGDKIAFIRVGTLDEPSAAAPDIHIYASTKQPWFDAPAGVPVVEEFYRFSDYWPAPALARYKAAVGA